MLEKCGWHNPYARAFFSLKKKNLLHVFIEGAIRGGGKKRQGLRGLRRPKKEEKSPSGCTTLGEGLVRLQTIRSRTRRRKANNKLGETANTKTGKTPDPGTRGGPSCTVGLQASVANVAKKASDSSAAAVAATPSPSPRSKRA